MSNIQGETPTLAGVLNSAQERFARGMQTAFPGKVTQDWDPATLTVEVEPQFHEVWRADEVRYSQPIPPIPNVPICFPRAGAYGMTFPIAKGDTVLVVCTKYNLDRWRDQAMADDPGDPRKFTLAGAVAIPGLYANDAAEGLSPTPSSDDLVVSSGSLIHLGDPANSQFIALANLVKAELDAVQTSFESIVFTVDTEPGGDTSGEVGTAYVAGEVAAVVGKAE